MVRSRSLTEKVLKAPTVFINGKFYSSELEGMPRVGREVTAAIDVITSESNYRGPSFQVVEPVCHLFRLSTVGNALVSSGNSWTFPSS